MTDDHTSQDAPESEVDDITIDLDTTQETIPHEEQESAIEQLLDEQDIQEQDAEPSVFAPIEQLATSNEQTPPSPKQDVPEVGYIPAGSPKQEVLEKEFDPHAFITLDEQKIARDETPEFWQSLSAGRHEKITYDTIEKQVLDTEINEILLQENRDIEPHEHQQFNDSIQELYKNGHLTRLEVAHFTARTNPQEFQTQVGWHLGKLADYETDGGPDIDEDLLKNPQHQLEEMWEQEAKRQRARDAGEVDPKKAEEFKQAIAEIHELEQRTEKLRQLNEQIEAESLAVEKQRELDTRPITYDTSIKSELHAIISEIERQDALESPASIQDIQKALEHLQQHNELSEREKEHFSIRLNSSQEFLKSISANYEVPPLSQQEQTTEKELSLPF